MLASELEDNWGGEPGRMGSGVQELWGRANAGGQGCCCSYYFSELLLSDKGSLRSRRLASTEHIFNMNHSRNNKNMKWLIKGPFHKGPS